MSDAIPIHYTDRDPLSVLRAEFAHARFHPGLLPHVAARFIDQPLLVEPAKLRTILALIGPRFGLTGIAPRFDGPSTVVRRDRSTDYAMTNGVAVVPFLGSVVKRNEGGVLAESGLVSLEAFKETVAAASADPTFRVGIIQMDSYGGEAVGTPEAARFLFDLRAGGKEWWCAIDDAAYSAGYYLAAACKRILISPSGGAGSIGVIALHVDASEALAAEGLKITPIFAGDRKIDGNEWSPLSPEARARFQARVDAIWTMFTDDVGQFRATSPAKLKSYQALTFYGSDAVAAGLADAVGTFDDLFTDLQSRVSGVPARQQGGTRMQEPEKPDAPTPSGEKVVSLEQYRSDTEASRLKGAAEERARCTRIDQIASAARMPKADAVKLATSLKAEGVSVEKAQDAFIAAIVEADRVAATTEITGPRGIKDVMAPGIAVPVMKSREEILASRFLSPKVKQRQAGIAAVVQMLKDHDLLDKVVEEGR